MPNYVRNFDVVPFQYYRRLLCKFWTKTVTLRLWAPLWGLVLRTLFILGLMEVKREYYQNCSVLDCVTQCSQSAAHSYEQFLQVQQIGFVTLGPLRHA